MRTPAAVAALSLLLLAPLRAEAPRAAAFDAQTPASRQADVAPDASRAAVPFREGAKIAYIDLPFIAAQSVVGKAAGARVKTLQDTRARELQSKQQAVEAKQRQLASGAGVLSESVRASIEAEIEKDGRDLKRMAEDADQDVQRMTAQLQDEFVASIVRAVTRVATEKKIDIVFTDQSAMAFRAEDLNLSADVIRVLDAGGSEPRK